MTAREQKLFVLLSEYIDKTGNGLDTKKIYEEIENMKWLPIDVQKPPQFEGVLVTIPGFKKPCIGAMWGTAWFLINQLDQSFDKSKSIEVIAWRYLPKAFLQ